MKKDELEGLFKLYPIYTDIMYDFSLGKSDYIRVKVSRIEVINMIPCFIFCNKTGHWPIEKRLIKNINEIGIGSTCQHLIDNRFDKSFKTGNYESM